jgi:ribonuclease H2 subunit C
VLWPRGRGSREDCRGSSVERARRVLSQLKRVNTECEEEAYHGKVTMLAIEKSKSHRGKCTPNILPCRINHNGPVDASKRYWNPTKTPGKIYTLICVSFANFLADGKTVAYFRGRKLHGKQMNVPKGYRGVVISSTDRILPKSTPAVENDEVVEIEAEVDVKIMEEQSEFDHIMLWGHEALPDEVSDPYVKGMEEWIALAEQVCFLSLEGVQSNISRSIPLLTKKSKRKTKRNKAWAFWIAWDGVRYTRILNSFSHFRP